MPRASRFEAILENPGIRRQVAPLSVESYRALGEMGVMPEKVELLRGVIVKKMSKSPRHSAVCQRLLRHLRAACEPALLVRQEQPLTLADSEPEPDLAVVPGRADDYADGHPQTALLVIEVAVSTEERDAARAGIYAEAGVPEYWLIVPASRQVTIFRQPLAAGYAERLVLSGSESLSTRVLPGFRLPLASLFA